MEGDRPLPHSLEAERAVLGGLMLSAAGAMDIAEILRPDDFYREAHGKLYQLLLQMAERGEPTEMVAVIERIVAMHQADDMGGLSYVSSLPDNVPSTENLEYYAKIVRERAVRRRLLAGLAEIADRTRSGADELPELLDFAESTIFSVTQEKSAADWLSVAKIVDQEFMRIQKLSERSGAITGITTGFIDMDNMLAGLQRTDLVILAARPAMGKCLAEDSQILLSDGRLASIAELVQRREGELLTLGEDLRLRAARPSDFIDDGRKPVFAVTTRLGRRVKTTLTHPFLTTQGWKPLGELEVGARVAVPRRLPVFGDEALGEARVRQLAEMASRGDPSSEILTAPRPEVASFLGMLFSWWGRLVRSPDGSSQAGELRLFARSEAVARQVQHLLLRFGVLARLGEGTSPCRWEDGWGDSFTLWIADQESIRAFTRDLPVRGWERELRFAENSDGHLDVSERIQGDVYWDEIVSIEPLGLQQVYDLTVPVTHNFIADDVCVHNTALALNLALNAARVGAGVGVFSLEMSAGQLVTRLLCNEARVDAGKVRTGFLSREHDWPRLTAAAETLYRLPIYLDDTPGINITQVRSKSRRLKATCPELGLIIVDYIGLMSGDGRVSRQEQVAASSRGLKALAKELNVCVLALSQLNRAVEQRKPQIPQIADLRESGSIEQDADIIMFIYRDEYYNKDSTRPNQADVIVAKQRNGPTGSVALFFEGKHTRFDNLAQNTGGDGYL